MSDENTTDFFDGIGEGTGAPTAVLKNPGDFVHGEIVKMVKRDYVPFGQTEPEKKADGVTNKQQLVIVLQTTNRNWANVVKVPKVDGNDPNSAEKAPSEDDGLRAVYVPEGKNLQFAIARAVNAASQKAGHAVKFEVGGTLGVKIDKLTPTTKGNPLKEHEAVYVPKVADTGAEFFGAAPGPAAVAPAQAPLAQGSSFGGGDQGLNPPAATTVSQPVTPAPAVQQDPWATPAAPSTPGDPWAAPAGGTDQPPF